MDIKVNRIPARGRGRTRGGGRPGPQLSKGRPRTPSAPRTIIRGRSRTPGRVTVAKSPRSRSGSRGPARRSRSRSNKRSDNTKPTPEGANPIVRDANVASANRVVTDVSLGATPQSPAVTFTTIDNLAGLIVAKYDSLCPGKLTTASTPSNDNQFQPVMLKAALIIVAWLYFKKIGAWTNASLINALPEVSEEILVPTPFAKLLQYFAPFKSPEGVEFTCVDSTSTLPTPTTTAGFISPANSTVFDTAPIMVYGSQTPSGSGELQSANGSNVSGATGINFVAQYMTQILSAVARVMPAIPFKNIPLVAPDASIHANVDGTSFLITCASKNFDPEVSLLLAPSRVAGGSTWGSYQKGIPAVSSPGTARGNLNFSTLGFPLGSILCGWLETLLLCPFLKGPVKDMLAKSDIGKLTSVVMELYDMDMRMWHTLISAQVQQLYDNSSPNPSGQNLYDSQAIIVALVLESVLTARLGAYVHLINPGFQCRSYSSAFRALSLPPWVSIFLWGTGPTIHNGRLRMVLPYNNPSGNQHWYGWTQTDGMVLQSSGAQGQWQGLFLTATYTPAFSLNGQTFTSMVTATTFCVTPVRYAQAFISEYNAAMGYTGANVTRGIDADLNKSFGSIANLAYVNIVAPSIGNGTAVTGQMTVTKALVGGTTTFGKYSFDVNVVASDVGMSRSDLSLACFMGLISCPALGVSTNKLFAFQTPVGGTVGLTSALVATQDNDEFTQSLGAARAQIAKFFTFNGQSMDRDLQGNFLMTALAGVAGPILANVIPDLAGNLINKFIGGKEVVPNPGESGNYFSHLGQLAKSGAKQYIGGPGASMSQNLLDSPAAQQLFQKGISDLLKSVK